MLTSGFVWWFCCPRPHSPLVLFIAIRTPVSIERGWGHPEFCGGLQSKQELAHLPAGGVQWLTLVKFVVGGGMNASYDREAPGANLKERDGKRVDPCQKMFGLHFI